MSPIWAPHLVVLHINMYNVVVWTVHDKHNSNSELELN